MSKNAFALALGIVLSLIGRRAEAFFDAPYVTPEHPRAGETISVSIFGGACDSILDIPGFPQITQTGNAIRILFYGVRYSDSELCYMPIGTATFDVGAYPVGSYTLQVDLTYSTLFGDYVDTLGVVPFTVTGTPAPIAAPALSYSGLAFLSLGFVGLAIFALRSRRSTRLLVAACLIPLTAHAQTMLRNRDIELLLTTAPGAPTAEEVVAYYQHPNGPPPIEG